ncbi:phage tail protein [Nitratireductor aquimarinus]|uniref:COG4223 family protein n=1 Tax=Nitratireductor aquimarinus TaxID=889300 RepID=UPI001A8D2CB8|nr:phage tail protein [Nitratireductor aquimarinus]MBN8244310.1 phage tail protein [Nitratireductor aquimarinus]MBY6132700.1 phage tail protein [Nitratireductor aquimarinus]MCA1304497.1 phage tail protein [Nitratireductor aquimarinus]
MVKTPRTRHSKTQKEPVTIDLDPDQVKREKVETPDAPGDTSKQEAKPEAQKPSDAARDSAKPEAAKAEAAAKPASSAAAKDDKAATSPKDKPASKDAGFGRDAKTGNAGARQDDQAAKSAKPEASTPATPAPAKSGGGAGRVLAGGVVGGVVALAIAGGLQWAGVLPALDTKSNAPDPAVEVLRQQVAALESKLNEQPAAGGESEAVTAALSEASARAGATEQRLAELGDEITTLRESMSSGAAGEGPGLEALSQRLATLEEQTASLSASGDAGAALEGVTAQLSTMETAVQGATEAARAANQSASGNATTLSTLKSELDALKAQVQEADAAPRMALVIAATTLKSAVERGTPYASELETYTAIAPAGEAEALAPLEANAASGVPSRATLAAEAPAVASSIVAAVTREAGDGGGGIIDNLMASARSLVVVRPVGSVEGEGPDAIAARMEAAVVANDYAKALAEYETLPEAGKQAAADFANKLQARQAADQILNKALADALKGA